MPLDISNKLSKLEALQKIDSSLDAIEHLKGTLPEEKHNLQAKLDDLVSQCERIKTLIDEASSKIKTEREKVSQAEQLIQRYSKQQEDVTNDREYEAIRKDIELQKLEVQLASKNTRIANQSLTEHKAALVDAEAAIDGLKEQLAQKQEALNKILEASQKDTQELQARRVTCIKKVDPHLLKIYEDIRQQLPGERAVVNLVKGSCSGCFVLATPQTRIMLKAKQQIMSCEHCGRLLAQVIEEAA